jgi:hypothetical protein
MYNSFTFGVHTMCNSSYLNVLFTVAKSMVNNDGLGDHHTNVKVTIEKLTTPLSDRTNTTTRGWQRFYQNLFLHNITSVSTNFVLNQIKLKISYSPTSVNRPALDSRGVVGEKSLEVM